MLRMIDSLNRTVLPNLPDLGGRAPLCIECKTCHRGAQPSNPAIRSSRAGFSAYPLRIEPSFLLRERARLSS